MHAVLETGGDVRSLKGPQLCAIGSATAEQLAKYGIKVDLIPAEFKADAVVRRAQDARTARRGARCCCRGPTSAARSSPSSCATPARSSPTSSPTATCSTTAQADGSPDIYRMLLDGEIEIVTFTSASAVRNFTKVLRRRAGGGPAEEDHRGGDRAGHRGSGRPARHRRDGAADHLHGAGAGRRHRGARGRAQAPLRDRIRRHGHHRYCPAEPLAPAPAAPPHRGHPCAGPRDAADARRFIYPLFVCEGRGVRRPISSMPGVSQLSVDEAVREADAAAGRRHSRGDAVRPASAQGRRWIAGVGHRRPGAGSDSRAEARRAGAGGHDRRVPVRVHVARPLRHRRGRRDRQRRHRGAAGGGRAVARRRRRRLRGAVGHDGRTRRRHPHGARRARLRPRRHHVARGEVLLGVLRPVPRGRRLHAAVRRPPQPPDGSRPTSKRRCARSRSTSPKAPTSSW